IEHIETEKYASDYWKPYEWLPENKHLWGKAHTYTVERTNRRIRHYLARLVRKTYCFSKSIHMLDDSILLFRYKNSINSIPF
ncbi:MAG: IS1 family transposase, partial [Alphaproteobacteria bacterium]|nr:IS1 family transposase [Alphaproteobacteria bacterium]